MSRAQATSRAEVDKADRGEVVPFTYAATAPTGMASGHVWYDTSASPPVAKFYDETAEDWISFSDGGGWATISTTPTGSYTDGDGDWDYWRWTASATGGLTVTAAGLLDTFIVGGGSGYKVLDGGLQAYGGSGDIVRGMFHFTAVAHDVVVGAGGAASAALLYAVGEPSSLGAVATKGGRFFTGAGASGADPTAGLASSITGASVTYGTANLASPVANRGDGGGDGPTGVGGSSGVVIVRRPS